MLKNFEEFLIYLQQKKTAVYDDLLKNYVLVNGFYKESDLKEEDREVIIFKTEKIFGEYLKGNVRPVVRAINLAMSSWGEDVFRDVATAYLSFNHNG